MQKKDSYKRWSIAVITFIRLGRELMICSITQWFTVFEPLAQRMPHSEASLIERFIII